MASANGRTHAAHRSIQLDVVQAVLAGFDFQRIFFGDVAQVLKIGVAIKRVIVDVHLGVKREYAAIGCGNERIDLKQ